MLMNEYLLNQRSKTLLGYLIAVILIILVVVLMIKITA